MYTAVVVAALTLSHLCRFILLAVMAAYFGGNFPVKPNPTKEEFYASGEYRREAATLVRCTRNYVAC